MDDIDRRILQLLKEDGRATNAEVGTKIGLSEGAVRRRIARMRAEGTILRFTVVTLPLGPEGLVLIRCRPGKTATILEHVRQRATEVFESSGEYDLGAIIECGTMDALNRELDAIRALDGVDATLTLIRLTRWQKTPQAAPGGAAPVAPSRAAPAPPPRRPMGSKGR
ncbi:MAG: Lrp/AsnC family transcriptional regulator [Euryarchaeota archaeon]|nr:Lrp/AsnC family transcriptional regulator [Euryarchaeota archaeon]MDE1835099.1 Lrp/AsnC family transcriptional regulator [Euryarchaeota archaeon]MDE1879371.1 Lrp/AsnC family transcriptional regulator [Euryarchaeota archaeon]MDE2044938.1 Lrp/AsnC family transcriptional regulator [Thermoplasmata archaeon]